MDKREATKIVTYMKEHYADPVSTIGGRGGDRKYCIGGAICHYLWHSELNIYSLGVNQRFPTIGEIASALSSLNSNLQNPSGKEAFEYAATIASKNDHGLFGDAWEVLRSALEYQKGGK